MVSAGTRPLYVSRDPSARCCSKRKVRCSGRLDRTSAQEQVLRLLRSHQDDILRLLRSHQDDIPRTVRPSYGRIVTGRWFEPARDANVV